MQTQIDHGRLDMKRIELDMKRLEQELRWEPYRAIAVIAAGVAAMAGIILAVAHLIR